MNGAEEVPTDEGLVKAALSGDDEAFAELVRRHKRRVFTTVSRFVRNHDELDDVCQEIFMKAYMSLKKYRGDAPFEHWLSKITINACYDLLRKRSRERDTMPLDAVAPFLRDPASGDKASGREAWEILKQGLARLRAEDRLVITLLHLDEKSVREVAESTGWSEAKVKVRAFRARRELKRILEDANGNRPQR
ncbi:MAG TPA: RNA polymerase sigma factor [Thermodesulfovibrionales bacterium]|nr:RNA polymerase sigma factor [Thermodesulfovibrionales bacterium]